VSLDDQALRDSIDAMARFFVGTASLGETLRSVSELANQALPQTEMTGITMIVDGRPSTAVFTDGEAPDIDVSQYDSGEGPCLQAFRTKQVVIIDSTETDDRFPSFCRAARAHGVNSTMSLPLIAGDDGIGALNLYSRAAAAFSEEDSVVGERFAIQASVVLANSQAYWDSRLLSEHLSEAMVSRATIEQAKGILMAQSSVTSEAAFEMLRDASQRENRKIREIAQELVERAAARRDPA
jgi:GAF domain-containing protein